MLKELIITIIIIIIIIRYKKSSHNFWISDDWWLREILVCKWNGRGKRGESRKFWKHDFKNRTDINCLMRRDNVGLFFLSTSPRSFFIQKRHGLGYLFWRQAVLIYVLSGYRQFVSLNSGWGKKTWDYAYLCLCGSDGHYVRMTVVSHRQMERIVKSTNVDHLKTTVKPCYNYIGLCDTLSITTNLVITTLVYATPHL